MYSKLITCLVVAEKNNDILMNNQLARLTSTMIVPKDNIVNNHMCDRIKEIGKIDVIVSMPKTTFLDLRILTRKGGEIMSKPKYKTCMVKM